MTTFDESFQKAHAAAGNQDHNFEKSFEEFMSWADNMRLDYYKKEHPQGLASGLFKPTLTYEPGKKYIRIVSSDSPSSRSAWAFVDTTNGNILKADGWKRPAPQPRGNVFEPKDWAKWVNQHGPASLRR